MLWYGMYDMVCLRSRTLLEVGVSEGDDVFVSPLGLGCLHLILYVLDIALFHPYVLVPTLHPVSLF